MVHSFWGRYKLKKMIIKNVEYVSFFQPCMFPGPGPWALGTHPWDANGTGRNTNGTHSMH
jgi:hypothetical protein